MVSSFRILHPPNIPTPESVQDTVSLALLRHLIETAEKSRWATNSIAADALNALLANFKFDYDDSDAPNDGPRVSRDDSAHDEYFGIQRSAGPAPEVFLRTILQANWILLEDAATSPFTVSPAKLNGLDAALNDLLLWTLGSTSAFQTSGRVRVADWATRGSTHHSMTRWIRGHQIFAGLTQGLIAVFADLSKALQQGDETRLTSAVDLAVLLLNGSAASLEFTGDFPSADYTDLIRPSMTPPLVPDTFSGLLSVDHRFFIQLLREMKPLLDSMSEQHPGHHARIASAVSAVYDSHRFVCDRLVGKCPSLMMSSGSKKSGAEQIEKFKHLRLKVFQPGAPSESGQNQFHKSEKVH